MVARRSVYAKVNQTRRPATPSYVSPKRSAASVGTIYSDAVFRGFTGLNTQFAITEIDDTESPDCLNVEFDQNGAITKRNGYTLKTTVASQIVSVLPFFTQSLNKLMLTFGTSIVQYDPLTNTSTNATTTLSANGAKFSGAMDTVHNKIYMVNGNSTDGLMSWDGTTFTTKVGTTAPAWAASTNYNVNDKVTNGGNVYQCVIAGTSAASGGPTGTGTSITDGTATWAYYAASGAAPAGQYTVWYKNHLYIAGDPNNPNRLYMSDQGDPTSWPALNFIDLDDGMGGITGLAQLGDSIVVFKQFDVFFLKGADPSSYIVVNAYSGKKGAVSHWTIVNTPEGLIFLAHDGVYLFNGKKFTLLSLKINIDNWNQAYMKNAVAFEYNHKYWLSVPEGATQSTNNVSYVYHYIYGWWTKHNIGMNAGGVFYGNTEEPTPYFSDTSGKLFQGDSGGTDNGSDIDAYFWTKPFDFGAQAHMKMFKKIFVSAQAEPGNYGLTLTFSMDLGKSTKTAFMPLSYPNPTEWGNFTWGQADWGGEGTITHYTTTVPGLCRYLQFKIEGIGSNAPFTVLQLMTQYAILERVT